MQNKTKVVFAVYHDTNSNGRAQQILHCAEMIGQSTLVSYRPVETWKTELNTKVVVTGNGKRKYLRFLIGAIRTILREQPDIVILHDNYCAALIPFIERMRKQPYIVYDSSELYIDMSFKSNSKFYLIQREENKYLHKANFIIAANIERALLMKDYFGLSEIPYVFENIRRIEDSVDERECEKKYGKFFDGNEFVIVYAGGISKNRMTYDIIKAVKNLGEGTKLIITGYKNESEDELYRKALEVSDVDNVVYMGFVSRGELKYLFGKADLSVSMFQKTTLNNINCASGKLHESLFEGCPVLTSTNPPLSRLCREKKIGVSTDDLESGIREIKNNRELFKNNVKEYISKIDVESDLRLLVSTVISNYYCYRKGEK